METEAGPLTSPTLEDTTNTTQCNLYVNYGQKDKTIIQNNVKLTKSGHFQQIESNLTS